MIRPAAKASYSISLLSKLAYSMARALSEIEQEIRALDPADQEHLLRALLEELDAPPPRCRGRTGMARGGATP